MEGAELLSWFEANARELPWRREPRDPYRVLVSELMLQQTQVDRVVPRFADFVDRFPTLHDLAAADEDAVLAAWSGLGYYRRARLLHRLARAVAAGGGDLPPTARELERLPGVGPYTAAAVASLAFGEAVPVLDGNVMRVAARVLASGEDPRGAKGRRVISRWARRFMAGHDPAQVNEALMELGATICRPRSPACEACPLAPGCAAHRLGRPELYPSPRRRRAPAVHAWVAACCVERGGRWLLRQVVEGPILRGLWLPPIAPLSDPAEAEALAVTLLPMAGPIVRGPLRAAAVQHSITHRRITVWPVLIEVSSPAAPAAGWRWAEPCAGDLPTSSLLAKLGARLSEVGDRPP